MKSSPYRDPVMARHYGEASAPLQFERPAHGLVAWLGVQSGHKVLDAGTGTGTVAAAAEQAVGMSGMVVAFDSSFEMLAQQKRTGATRLVLAQTPDLPFRDEIFDCVAAGFVISHFPDYGKSLIEIKRVLRPGGTFGATAWAGGQTIVSRIWSDTMKQFADAGKIQRDFERMIPWDEWFSSRENLAKALEDSDFVDVQADTKPFLISVNAKSYILSKMGSVEGTILRQALKEEEWKRFLEEVERSLLKEFPGGIEYQRNVHFVIGSKERP